MLTVRREEGADRMIEERRVVGTVARRHGEHDDCSINLSLPIAGRAMKASDLDRQSGATGVS